MAVETNTNGAGVDTPPPPQPDQQPGENREQIAAEVTETAPDREQTEAEPSLTIDTSASPAERADAYHRSLRLNGFTTRELVIALTPDEEHACLLEVGEITAEIEKRASDLKEHSADERAAIKHLEKTRKERLDEAVKGKLVEVECEIRIEDARAMRLIIRRDTGEVVFEEPVGKQDRQTSLPLSYEGETQPRMADRVSLPFSRLDRDGFCFAIENGPDRVGPAEKAYLRLHADGVLDPSPGDLAEQRRDLPTVGHMDTDDWIAGARLGLDECERELIAALGSDEDPGIVGRILAGEFGGIGDKPDASGIDSCVHEIRSQRAILDAARELATKVADPKPAPPSRDRKPVPEGPPSDRGLSVYRAIHRDGRLDPTDVQLTEARKVFEDHVGSGGTLEGLAETNGAAIDSAESELLDELRKPRMKAVHDDLVSTGTTKRPAVMNAILTVRSRRAIYDVLAAGVEVATEPAEASDAPESAGTSAGAAVSDEDYQRLKKAIAGATREKLPRGGKYAVQCRVWLGDRPFDAKLTSESDPGATWTVFDEGGTVVTHITAAGVAMAARSIGTEE
jgi:hypothetical protein